MFSGRPASAPENPMNALVLAFALAPGPLDPEAPLPRNLADEVVPLRAGSGDAGSEIFVGVRFGTVEAVDAEDAGLLAGFEWRIHILPWLSVDGTIDAQSTQEIEQLPQAEFYQVPVTWSFLLHPPVDLGPLRLHGVVGGGFTVTHVSGVSELNSTDLNLLGCLGGGLELRLSPRILLAVDARYVWAHSPAEVDEFDADWVQVTAGLLFKLPV